MLDSYGGRVARLQAAFATAARGRDHYEVLDEREIASGLKNWLVGKNKLGLQRATHFSEELVRWAPNYSSVEEHVEFAKAKFDEDIAEGLMLKMPLRDFKAKYGEHRAIAALAVIVEDESVGKKRMIHDATHGVRVIHRIRCRDKIRAPGAREKKQLLREMVGYE